MNFKYKNYFSCSKYLISIIIVALNCQFSFGQNIFSNEIEDISPNNYNPYTIGQTLNQHIISAGIQRGVGISGRNANNRYNAQSWSIGNTLQEDKYFEFIIKIKPGFKINFKNLTFSSSRSSDGPNQLLLKTSLDSYTNISANPQIIGDTISLYDVKFQNITDSIKFRIYGIGATSNLGTLSIDEFKFVGDVIPINTIVPDITSTLVHEALLNYPSNDYQIIATNYPTKFNAFGLPAGLKVDTLTGIISGTPIENLGSPYSVTITASNSEGSSSKTLQYSILLNSCYSEDYVKFDFGTSAPTQQPSNVSTNKVSYSNISRNNTYGSVTSLINNASQSAGYDNSSGNYNATASCNAGTFNNLSTYFELSMVNDADFATIIKQIQFGSRSTATGPTKYLIKTSVDNYDSIVASGDLSNNSNWSLVNQNITIGNDYGGIITFRIYGYNGTGGTSLSNWRIDDLHFEFSTIRRPPEKFNLSSNTNIICKGNNGVELKLDSSQLNVEYQLVLNDNNIIGEKILGTGSTLSLGTQSLAGNYSVLASYNLTNCVEIMSNTINLSEISTNTWTGNISNDWDLSDNWSCLSVPNIHTKQIIIPVNTIFQPKIFDNITVYGDILFIDTNSTIDINGYQLSIQGSITGEGSLIGSNNSILNFEGSDIACSFKMNQASNTSKTLKKLLLNRNANLSLLSETHINENVEILSSNGAINSNEYLTLLSTQNSVSSIGYLQPNNKVNGLVNVELFLQGGSNSTARGTRMISIPVKDDLVSPNFIFEQIKNKVFITGEGNISNNFDLGGTSAINAHTIVTYDEFKKENEYGFTPLSNILNRAITGKSYFLFFRGDRIHNIFNKLNQPFANPENVTLNFKGVINQGDILVPVTYTNNNLDNYNGYNAVGNPYPAVIDFDLFLADNSDKIENIISIIKPDKSGQITMSNGISTNNNVNDSTGSIAESIRYIQPGQGFYIRVKSGQSGNIIFKESHKKIISQPSRLLYKNYSANNDNDLHILKIKLKNEISQNECCIVFNENNSSLYESKDAINFRGGILNIASKTTDDVATSINFTNQLNQSDTLNLFINSLNSESNINLYISESQNLNNYEIILTDKYLNIQHLLSNSNYNFKIDKNNPNTYGDNRFQLIIQKKTILSNDNLKLNLKKLKNQLYLNWTSNDVQNADNLELFCAIDSANFKLYDKIPIIMKGIKSSYLVKKDLDKLYVRLVQKNFNKSELFSNIVYINFQNSNEIKLYPNPAKDYIYFEGEHLNLKNLNVEIYNSIGQIIYQKKFNKYLNVSFLPSGNYRLLIKDLTNNQVLINKFFLKI